METGKKYLQYGSARDIERTKDRIIYRIFECIPGILLWTTFAAMVLGSLYAPLVAAIFIILFDLYWLLRSVYFSWHLRETFKKMREYMRTDWVVKLDALDGAQNMLGISNWRKDIWHLVILPYYKEDYEIIKNTCEAMAASPYPNERILVVLTGEARAGEEAQKIGERIAREYEGKFGKFLFTTHVDQYGELAGKGANETWAAKIAQREIVDAMNIPYEQVILSVFDVDTVVSPQYFGRLTYCYLTAQKPLRSSYQPIPLFINNIWEAPAVARVVSFSSTFWHMMNHMRPERLTSFSSHAFPFKTMAEIGFWQTNVVSEDSRIFWEGFLAFDGDWRVVPLFIPVSMDANVASTFWQTMKNLYLQQRRWAYGCENIPYFLFGFLKNKKISFKKKCYWTFHIIEGFWSWSTNSFLIFLLGWLPVVIGGAHFGTTVLAYNTPRLTRIILTLAMLGIITSIYLSLVLLPPRPFGFGKRKYLYMILQWIMIPITLVFLGSLPAIEAETRLMFGRYLGFWPTPKIRKGIQKEVFAVEHADGKN
ncbi:MAG: glycosyltransferase family 2 protein [Candidatus Sungbacteria bacterium]|nr:glycosyltransferase family 2 protein [Candidatus Sungbacteria bacterium]